VKVKVRNPNEGTVSDLAVASHLAADPGVAAGAAPAGSGNVIAPNGPAFRLSTPLGPGQAIELPARIQVGAGSGPGRVRVGATATGRYGDGTLAVPANGALGIDGPVVTGPAAQPGEPKISVGGKKGTATAGTPTGSGGRKPARTSAGVTGAAGSAASAAPVAPATTPVTPAPAPPVEPAPAPEAPPAPATEPGSAPAPPTTAGHEAAAPRLKRATDRGHWAWGGAAAVFLAAIAAAAVTRLLGGARR
ncbi:MAG: hypothetical protein LC792_13895, partial [Actinobacteria bacterium]|nr:hypothetical protein [Actinomycetota bacterium]